MADRGRPRKYKSSQELSEAIDKYFGSITITTPRMQKVKVGEEPDPKDPEKMKPIYEDQPVLNDNGDQIYYKDYIDIPSILGLSLFLGIDRHTLQYYEENPLTDEDGAVIDDYSTTIKKARQKIEKYVSDQLHREKNVTGIIFNLKNNFGWVDKQEVESTNVNLNHEMTDEEAEKILKQHGIDPNKV